MHEIVQGSPKTCFSKISAAKNGEEKGEFLVSKAEG
jgi:hypothetical protein